ncbi:rab-like protein 2a-like protein [Chrysochromulina tobinii]|jgi:Rab-like protein 2|uniref:Rab-like protein 2a-like protein n=1 Tax=Chrysochromulina tobinii TaxID=1460289 RepID=A0A0M0KAM2_9EUKA|nr:rab-like protein 2a-like protein [Chrysochromulina tobinii]|eukprot:KOO35885.1 rab-like protein 2a-like protein [Chrysochromulina sp. CCMP291]
MAADALSAPPPPPPAPAASSTSGALDAEGENALKIILLGDSAVGKSKLVERFLMQDYQPRMLSTYALTLFRYNAEIDGQKVAIDFWDTAGQERFNSMHPAYYHQAHACILCFDVTRKQTYKNLPTWVKELRDYRSKIPTICIANKVDVDAKVMSKDFAFPKKHNMKLYFCSAADGTNVVSAFEDAIQSAHEYKNSGEVDDVDLLLSLVNGTASMRVSKEEGGGEGATAAVPAS